jgi:hypothetical protein
MTARRFGTGRTALRSVRSRSHRSRSRSRRSRGRRSHRSRSRGNGSGRFDRSRGSHGGRSRGSHGGRSRGNGSGRFDRGRGSHGGRSGDNGSRRFDRGRRSRDGFRRFLDRFFRRRLHFSGDFLDLLGGRLDLRLDFLALLRAHVDHGTRVLADFLQDAFDLGLDFFFLGFFDAGRESQRHSSKQHYTERFHAIPLAWEQARGKENPVKIRAPVVQTSLFPGKSPVPC